MEGSPACGRWWEWEYRLGTAANPAEPAVLAKNSVLERRQTRAESIQVRKDITLGKSERTFKLWEYRVGHGQLLIRSPKAPATDAYPEYLTNVDLIFIDAQYVAVPKVLRGIELLPVTPDEVRDLESILGRTVPPANVTVLFSNGRRFPVVASNRLLSENDWDIFESPFGSRQSLS